jgi:Fic family protein
VNIETFRNSPSGQLVQGRVDGKDYWAFAPHPLPPDLRLDLDLWNALSDADRALGELAGLGHNMPNPHILIGPFLRREAVLSSRIEGTRADVADVYAYEAGQLSFPGFEPSPPSSDVQEVVNYVCALEYGLERIKERPLSLQLLRELHEILMQGVRGERYTPGQFRRVQNWIGRSDQGISGARFVPPTVPLMQDALRELEAYIERDCRYPLLIRIGLIHYQFETIHPFVDGNGRIGRLLISLLLVYWNLLPLPLLYLSAYFEQHRDEYNDQMLAVSEKGTWNEWLLFFLKGVIEQSRDAIAKAKQLHDLQFRWRHQLLQAQASASPLRLADSLFASPVLTVRRAESILGVTFRAAQRNVDKLVEVGILKPYGESGRGRLYVAEELLEITSAGRA